MHPIERLRWIARAHGEAPTTLATEAAWTISELALDEPPALVTACRRLLESHVTVGPLWWVAATVLVAPDPDQAARRAVGSSARIPRPSCSRARWASVFVDDAVIVVACPAETVRDALGSARRPSSVVVGSSPELRGEVRGFEAAVDRVSWLGVRRGTRGGRRRGARARRGARRRTPRRPRRAAEVGPLVPSRVQPLGPALGRRRRRPGAQRAAARSRCSGEQATVWS